MDINIKLWYNNIVNNEYSVVLVLAGLHYNKLITEKKIKGQFNTLRKGILLKGNKTYYCDINNKWYDIYEKTIGFNDTIYTVFEDIIDDLKLKTIPYNIFIEYLQKYLNCNYNYAVNIFGHYFIYQLFKEWNPEYHDIDFLEYINFKPNNLDIKGYRNRNECVCCGCYNSTYDKKEFSNYEKLNNWLHSIKKGNLKYIPFYNINKNLEPYSK